MADQAEAPTSIRDIAAKAIADAGLDESNWPQESIVDSLPLPQETETDETDEDTDEVDTEESDETDETDDSESQESEDAGDRAEDEDEETDESAATDEDVPTEYFGIDLSPYAPEDRKTIIEELRNRDKVIQDTMRSKKSKDDEDEEGDENADPPVQDMSDEEIMEALGYSKDDPLYDVKSEVALPIAKQVANLTGFMREFVMEQQTQQFIQNWENTVTSLEDSYGKLPISHEELAQYALDNNIVNPVDAYNRYAMEGQKFLRDKTKALNEAKKTAKTKVKEKVKKKPSTARPSAPGNLVPPAKNLTPKEAAAEAAKRLGFDWSDALS